jgi:hypothetical protein
MPELLRLQLKERLAFRSQSIRVNHCNCFRKDFENKEMEN